MLQWIYQSAIYRTAVAMVLGLLMLFTQSGCLVVAAAAGTGAGVAYVRGDLETSFDADPKTLSNATESALKSMDVAVISSASTALDGKIVGRTARDVKIEVCITGEGGNLSKASIRAGIFGDSALQERIAGEIRKQLQQSAKAPATQPATQPAVADVK